MRTRIRSALRLIGYGALEVAVIFITLVVCVRLGSLFDWPRLPLGWFLAGLMLASCVHELGHLVFAKLTSTPVRKMTIGIGPALLSMRLRTVDVEVRLIPIGGLVERDTTLTVDRRALLLVIAGGGMTNLLFASALLAVHAAGVLPPHWTAAWQTLIIAQLAVGLQNFLPFRDVRRGLDSDGLLLWRMARTSDVGQIDARLLIYRRMLEPYGHAATGPFEPSPASSRIFSALANSERLTSDEVRRQTCASLERELDSDRLTIAERLLVLDTLITSAVLYEEPDDLARLAGWSATAIALAPQCPTIQGSYGAALVGLGRHGEARGLFSGIVDKLTGMDRMLCCYFAAIAERRSANEVASARWAEDAREIARHLDDTPWTRNVVAMMERKLALGSDRPAPA
ncbi:MAG: site-2 protease family protein [Hyphomicrobiaceae bacterium]